MRLWIWLWIFLLPSLGACHCEQGRDGKCRDAQSPSDAPLTAKWQLFDADTEKPIEGAWINFLWYGKADLTCRLSSDEELVEDSSCGWG